MINIDFIRLDHIQICIPKGKEAQARAFYGNLLGLKEIEKPEPLKVNGGLWFEIADIQLHIGTEIIEGRSKRHPAFEIANLSEVKLKLQEAAIRIKEDIPIEGLDRFSFYDPFDNRIEFLQKK